MLKRRDANPYTSRRGRWVKPVLCIPFLVAGYFAYRLSFHTNPLTFLDLGMKPNVETLLTEDYEFHLSMHPKDRNDRFPSVDKRVSAIALTFYLSLFLLTYQQTFFLHCHDGNLAQNIHVKLVSATMHHR